MLGKHQEVFSKFDKHLFLKLKPPFVDINLLNFGGTKKGEIIALEIKPLFSKTQLWESLICDLQTSEAESFFVDVGKTLPWPLKTWEHKHIIKQINHLECEIIDDIRYTCQNFVLELLYQFPMWLMFYARRRIYKKIFGSL